MESGDGGHADDAPPRLLDLHVQAIQRNGEMTQEEIVECFEKHDGQFLKFKEVKAPLSSRPDLHAFLTLDRLVPSGSDMVCGAEHDEIFLDVNVEQLKKAGIRADIDASDDRFQKKIRNAQLQKIPFMLIAGEEDMKAGAVSFRYRNGDQKNGVPIADAIAEIAKVVAAEPEATRSAATPPSSAAIRCSTAS